ncbi:MAG: DUF192 domain-containing protein [Actinobacteria bacterium]|nr:MAG: DUF192 domain-containing protein [Actinomycetota bacterium]
MRRAVVLVGVGAIAFAGCSSRANLAERSATQHRTLVVNGDPTPICVAVATTVAQQLAGLGSRPSLPPKQGMAFPFGSPSQPHFTMRQTSFPLAIVWVGPNSQVLGSTSMVPLAKDDYPSPAPITLAVEVSPQEWQPLEGTAVTATLGDACNGTVTAGPPGQGPSRF